jgi:hypothetical protein
MKLKSPHPSLRATLSPLGRGEGVVVSSLWLDSIRPQAKRCRFSLSPPNGERAGARGVFRLFEARAISK